MAEQRIMRLLALAPTEDAPRREIVIGFVLGPDGSAVLEGNPTPERRREIQAAILAAMPRDDSMHTTCRTPDDVQRSARALLRSIATRNGDSPLHEAGRLFVAHGDRARWVLAVRERSELTDRIDAHLGRAGVPAVDVLPGILP